MVIVVGGHSRNIGKTSVVCGVIRALPGWNWTAIKITQYGHGICSRDGEACDCSDPAHPIAVSQETGATPSTDSGRFLAAGAARAFWVRTPAGELNEAMPRVRRLLAESENTIIESNSILRFLQPDVCAMVLDGGVADFKPTSLRFLDRANVLVVTGDADPAWPQVSVSLLRNKPRFAAPPPRYENPEFIAALVTANSDLFSGPKLLK
ncbi:MAG: hypothetical protein ABSG41_16215 [Bryobacteraceae bacterium]|jgi:hypothetical protein